jgi:fructose transport system permease protein
MPEGGAAFPPPQRSHDMSDNYEAAANRDDQVAQFGQPAPTLAYRLQHRLHGTPSLVPLLVLVGAVTIFGVTLGERFLSPFALTLILQQVQIVGIVALAQSIVILTAGIDLSVGAIMVLSSVVMGQFTFRYGLPPEVAVVCGLLCGALAGLISGVLVAYVRLPPFIVTLGMWQILLAANFLYSRNETIRSQDIQAEAPLLQFFGTRLEIGGAIFTVGVIFMLLLAVVLAYALRHTAWGRHVYAVGDDPEAAELAGVNVRATLISVYVLAGPDLRVCRLGVDRTDRIGFADLRPICQY